jgi:hypothetical protein
MSTETFGNILVIVSGGQVIVIIGGKVVSAVRAPKPLRLMASATGRIAQAVAEMGEGDATRALAPTAETLCTSLVAQFQTDGTPSMVLYLDDDTPFCGTPAGPRRVSGLSWFEWQGFVMGWV